MARDAQFRGTSAPAAARAGERGSVLLAAIVIALLLAGFAASTVSVVQSVNREAQQARDDLQRTYIAQSAASFAEIDLVAGGTGELGSEDAPIPLGSGSYWTTAEENPDRSITLTCYGAYHDGVQAIAATFLSAPTLFDNAIFAGNSSGDPDYVLEFGGSGGSADEVTGDVYSGGDVAFAGDATIDGMPRAAGSISGAKGEEGKTQIIPDLEAMKYDEIADVDVAKEFGSASYKSNSAGGSAWELGESNPAHIFRKNPSDRSTETGSTKGDDYFLEDPYEKVSGDSKSDGSDPYVVSLSGAPSKSGTDGNGLIYYIDGNLWIHNRNTFSFEFASSGDLAITIVVRGNIYISDNIYYDDPKADGLALIAMANPDVADSGNIYFGDPVFGTLEHMSAYMYAENNFYDTNLSATGSAKVSVDGMMSAGNQVAIERDFLGVHSKLTVNFDDRVASGALALPGLPESAGTEVTFLAWTHATLER